MQANNTVAVQPQPGFITVARNKAHEFIARMRASIRFVMAMVIVATMSGATFAQSDIVALDTDIFITQINQWLPMALQIVAIGVGIAAAFALAGMVGMMLVNAFKGRFGM